jgi:hypothetical protein
MLRMICGFGSIALIASQPVYGRSNSTLTPMKAPVVKIAPSKKPNANLPSMDLSKEPTSELNGDIGLKEAYCLITMLANSNDDKGQPIVGNMVIATFYLGKLKGLYPDKSLDKLITPLMLDVTEFTARNPKKDESSGYNLAGCKADVIPVFSEIQAVLNSRPINNN